MSTNRSILIEANKGENTFKFWSFVLNRENEVGLIGVFWREPYTLPYHPFQSYFTCLLYTSPSPRDRTRSRMPSSA